MLKHLEFPGCFSYAENYMEKSEKNKLKDYKRLKGKTWKRIPSTLDRRRTGSGIEFEGRYVSKKL